MKTGVTSLAGPHACPFAGVTASARSPQPDAPGGRAERCDTKAKGVWASPSLLTSSRGDAAATQKPLSTNLDTSPGDQGYKIQAGALKRAGFLQKLGIYHTVKITVGFTDLRSRPVHLKQGQCIGRA